MSASGGRTPERRTRAKFAAPHHVRYIVAFPAAPYRIAYALHRCASGHAMRCPPRARQRGAFAGHSIGEHEHELRLGAVRRVVAASTAVAGLVAATATAAPGGAGDDVRVLRGAAVVDDGAGTGRCSSASNSPRGSCSAWKPDAVRLGLAAGWERATLTMLLMQPASSLAEGREWGARLRRRDGRGGERRVETKALGECRQATSCSSRSRRAASWTRAASAASSAPLPAVRPFDIAQRRSPPTAATRAATPVTLAGVASDDADRRARGEHRDRRHEPGRAGLPRRSVPAGCDAGDRARQLGRMPSPSAQDSNAAIITMDQTAQATDEFEILRVEPGAHDHRPARRVHRAAGDRARLRRRREPSRCRRPISCLSKR